ncbi:MAG: TetR/AcrR family transcriptional regulator [Bacteroidia bacterium]|nr:TetR/AcrR family transcriptional regulator [Bacteroidia bacterium]
MNEKLYLRDPELSVLGKKIVKQGLELIIKLGFEDFTFKKLAIQIDTTEASIYRYFENKHRLLTYLMAWHWSYLEQKMVFYTNNIKEPELRLRKILELLAAPATEKSGSDFITERLTYDLVMSEGAKAYMTKHVNLDNRDRLFKPYKDLCGRFAAAILEYNPKYKFAHSLASTLLETAHSQKYFMHHLPSLTDFGMEKDDKKLLRFLEALLFDSIKPAIKK